MRQFKYLITSTVVLFLLINTDYYWKGSAFGYGVFLMLFYLIAFFILTICLVRQLILVIEERFKNKHRIYLILIMSLLLGLIVIRPTGIINFEKLEGKDLLVAWQEGTANCSTTLKLKENKKCTLTSICFGEDKLRGTYVVSKDTIKLKFSGFSSGAQRYEYGIFTADTGKYKGEILLYTSKQDTMPYPLIVFENELIK